MKNGCWVETDIPYGSDPMQSGDLFLAPGFSSGTPVVLNIHGGGWSSMSRKDAAAISRFLVETGCAVFSIDYRLAGREHPWPACGDDSRKAADFLLGGGLAAHGVVPDRLWIVGVSSGGHLALWTGFHLPPERVAGVVSISGIADPVPDAAANPHRYRTLFGGCDPTPANLGTVDIVRLAQRGGPRVLLTHAEEDTVVPFASAENFHRAYRAAGGDVTLRRYSTNDEPNWGGHCIWRRDLPVRERLLSLVEDEIARFMGRKKA